MKGRGLQTPAIAFTFVVLLLTVGSCEDIYLEGDDTASSEQVEIRADHGRLTQALHRIRRGFFDFLGFTEDPKNETESITETPKELVDNNLGKDDEDFDTFGSGLVPDREPEPTEKTLRVSFLVMEPYQSQYSNRDSPQFRNFSKSIADAVNVLYETLPGNQRASLVRIQSLVEDFKCKVTLDIVTTGYDNTDRIAQILREHIQHRANLGSVAVSDTDFSATIIDPGAVLPECPSDELRCDDGNCVPGNARCDGTQDCSDGSDEFGCPPSDDFWSQSQGEDTGLQTTTLPPLPTPHMDESEHDDFATDAPEATCADAIQCWNSLVFVCKEKLCDGVQDCPYGDDEQRCFTSNTETEACPPGDFSCDVTRCVPAAKKCDAERDCDDGTDEAGCPQETCGIDDFRCRNGKCIESSKRCDRVADCANEEDEQNCVCKDDEFRCKSDGSCIEGRKRCDNSPNCKDNSDELDCACGIDEWQCDHGSCIKRHQRCDGKVDCPSDRSDERLCLATPPSSSQYFRCSTGSYIPISLKCNRQYDCPPGDYSDEKNCPCGEGDFKCDNGYCIPASKHCDNTHDCQDGSDERHCTNANSSCMAYEYKCTDGTCVAADARCDGTRNCADGSDELSCPCRRGEFTCQDGACVSSALICNGFPDCRHGEDERNCAVCRRLYSACGDGSCYRDNRRCDGHADCADGSDEKHCDNTLLECPEGRFLCNNGSCATPCDGLLECGSGEDEDDCEQSCALECDDRCLDDAQICDGIADCSDGSDELLCGTCEGPADFRCQDGECVNAQYRCNGISECRDGSDELDCQEQGNALPQGCIENQFQCRDGTCIDKKFYCDGHRDCYDNTDEDNCRVWPRTLGSPESASYSAGRGDWLIGPWCPDRDFTCYDGRCIPHTRRCDNIYDCQDFSDEQNCYHSGCQDSEMQCTSGQCVPSDAFCDGRQDCTDGSDELNCITSGPYRPDDFPTTTARSYYTTARPYYTTARPYYTTGRPYYTTAQPSYYTPAVSFTTTGAPYRPYLPPPQQPQDECSGDRWRCEISGACIESRRRCDGRLDCPARDDSDEVDCPPGSPVALNLKSYPEDQTVRYGGDVVFQCRDEGPQRAPVRWVREGGRPLKPGSIDRHGRLEMNSISVSDSGVYICQAPGYLGYPSSELRVTLRVNAQISTPRPIQACQMYEATCRNGQCIPKSAVCDGKPDCSDRSDEEECDHNDKCEPNQFRCPNRSIRTCILKTWLCDSEDDCGDGSDELNCVAAEPGQPCLPTEFACQSNNQCIPKAFHCDGQKDCADMSDEFDCRPVAITRPPQPQNIRLNPGETLTLRCESIGTPVPLVTWRLNWGHVPDHCTSTSYRGVGVLTCTNMQPEHSGAYSCEAINNKGTVFAVPDAIVFVNRTEQVCPPGYFNNEAQSPNECIRCFCFGEATQCRSADLYTYNMPTPLGEGGTMLQGVTVTYTGNALIDSRAITDFYYYQPLRNGAAVTKLEKYASHNAHPYVSLPESYNGNQLTSYGGHIRYRLQLHSNRYVYEENIPDIIVKGKHGTLVVNHPPRRDRDAFVEVAFLPGSWQKAGPRGLSPATREDIMMALDNIEMLLLRADMNGAGVNITDFSMESAQYANAGLGAANLVEECQCPPGYEGLSCQKCASGYDRERSGPWLGNCVREEKPCPAGTYGDPASGMGCRPCPCPMTNRENQFARTCSLGPNGRVICDCMPGYEGANCEACAPGYVGNPNIPGDSCRPQPAEVCNAVGTLSQRFPSQCECKDNVRGRYCDRCSENSFFLSEDFRHGCAQCFCTGVTQQCSSSNLRRKTLVTVFNVPQLVDQVAVYTSPLDDPSENIRYNAPYETALKPIFYRGEISLSTGEQSQKNIYYWSLPASFAGDKVTSYGGYLRYTLRHISILGGGSAGSVAPDVLLISKNQLTFHYFGNFAPSSDGYINGTVQFLEKGWQRPDGKEVQREYLLQALSDVKTILIKATYSNTAQVASLISASIDIAEEFGDGPQAMHVEQCVCPTGYLGTSCEDCAPGFTRSGSGLYLELCEPCNCNGHSDSCDPETGCFDCADNTVGINCEMCKPGFERDRYNNCVRQYDAPSSIDCNCDPRGEGRPCDSGRCICKVNAEGEYCDKCRHGTFGLDQSNPEGCIPCFCSGVTNECYEATHYARLPLPAPIFGENYGGYTLMDLDAEQVINDQIVPATNESELMYIFSNRPTEELYWSLPVFAGNRILSYGGYLSLTQKFETGGSRYPEESEPGVDVVLVGEDLTLFWTHPRPLRSGQALTYQVLLKEKGWYILNSDTPVTRNDFMKVLRNLRRVLVRATLSQNVFSTAIADVSMDTALENFADVPAKGIEMCKCPPGYIGSSCESCAPTYYKDTMGQCRQCTCNGHECQLGPYGTVLCQCRAPYIGPDCSTVGLIMELHPVVHERRRGQSFVSNITMVCKYKAPEPLTIQFYYEGKEIEPPKWYNESWLERDGWHGEHEWHTTWDMRQRGRIVECHTVTREGSTLGMLTGRLPSYLTPSPLPPPPPAGESPPVDLSTEAPPPRGTIVVRITSPTIKIQEVGGSVNFTCEAQSHMSRRPLSVAWSKADGYLPQGRHYVDDRSGLLVITNLQVSDSGRYICQARDGMTTEQAFATLQVPGNEITLPVVELRPPFSEYYEGDRVQLECIARGNPTPRITWQRSLNRPLPYNAENFESQLVIDRVSEEDSGEYRCTATNRAGAVSGTAFITVRPRPSAPLREKLTITPTAVTINEAQTTRIVCTGTNKILPGSIEWARQDGTAILGNIQSSDGVLYIEGARLENQGLYICQTSSPDVAPVSVLVNIIPLSTPPPAETYKVSLQTRQLKIPTGGTGIIDCSPIGYPAPIIKWKKHEGEFEPNTSQRDNALIINGAVEENRGYYMCEGLLDGVPVAYDYVSVEIERREPPQVEIWPTGEQVVSLGRSFEFLCRVMGGEPEPEVMWDRNGGRTLSPHAQILPRNVLKFEKVEVNDEGKYTCTATNIAGSASASAVLKVHSPPEITVPSHVSVVAGDPINVECRANGYPEPMVSIRQEYPIERNVAAPSPGLAGLRVPSASSGDEGTYVCTATSAGVVTDVQFAVTVDRGDGNGFDSEGSGEEPLPDYDDRPKVLYAIEGQDASIQGCNSTQDDVRWSRDGGGPLQPNARQIGSNLYIYRITQADAGYYECNQLDRYTGEPMQSYYTRVEVKRPPHITLRPPKQTVRPGQSTTVECIVDGDDIVEVAWRPLTKPFSRRVIVRDSLLMFNQIEVEDEGRYECFAKNQIANASLVAEVQVSEELWPEAESIEQEQRAHVGASVHLRCVVSRPDLRVRWSKNGRPLPRALTQNADGSLTIRLAQISDSGQYSCTVQDKNGRQTTTNITNLHIVGRNCEEPESLCPDDVSPCADAGALCGEQADCSDANCSLTHAELTPIIISDDDDFGDRMEAPSLVSIEQPRRPFQVREDVQVLCKSRSRDTTVRWERPGFNQYLDTTNYGDGSILKIRGVEESDAGMYRCIGSAHGITSYEDFNLEVVPGPAKPPTPANENNVYTARVESSVTLPCLHNLEAPVTIQWQREYLPISSDIRTDAQDLVLESVTEADAGVYTCRVSNGRVTESARAVLRVTGVVPRFDGNAWLALPTLKDAFRKFDIELSFKPTDSEGLILYNSEKEGRQGDYLALQLVDGVPRFVLDNGSGAVEVRGDRPLLLNVWHTVRISWDGTKVTMDVDNTGPFTTRTPSEYIVLELKRPMYIGGVPDYHQLPATLEGATGFVGCVSMLVLGREEKDIMSKSYERYNTQDCDSCSPNQCRNNAVCQEAHNERGYSCLCANGFTGLDCDRAGDAACRPGLCGPGKCVDTADGHKCVCPASYTGERCESKQSAAYSGPSFLAWKIPANQRLFRMSLKMKPFAPVTDGIVMYGAESAKSDSGGFTSLAVRDQHLEFRFDLGDGPVILRSSRPLRANELVDVRLLRSAASVTMTVDKERIVNGTGLSPRQVLNIRTPLYIGGYDDSIVLNRNTGVSGAFNGCVKDVFVLNYKMNFSGNGLECVDRGDIPEVDICSQCHNGGYCMSREASACTCPPGFSGLTCDERVPANARAAADPCAAAVCSNGGTCRPDRTNSYNNYTCDCILGFAGTNCQMSLQLQQSVGFNGNGYLELPAQLMRHERGEPAMVAVALRLDRDGVLLYQHEAGAAPGAGDYIMLRVQNGKVVLEWNAGSGVTSLSVDDVYVSDNERHTVIANLYGGARASLEVDSMSREVESRTFSNIINADSNIYIGGIPESLNVWRYPGLNGCFDQVEVMSTGRALVLGEVAVAARNTQRCRKV